MFLLAHFSLCSRPFGFYLISAFLLSWFIFSLSLAPRSRCILILRPDGRSVVTCQVPRGEKVICVVTLSCSVTPFLSICPALSSQRSQLDTFHPPVLSAEEKQQVENNRRRLSDSRKWCVWLVSFYHQVLLDIWTFWCVALSWLAAVPKKTFHLTNKGRKKKKLNLIFLFKEKNSSSITLSPIFYFYKISHLVLKLLPAVTKWENTSPGFPNTTAEKEQSPAGWKMPKCSENDSVG